MQQLVLYAIKFVAEDVLQNLLMHRRNKLHNGMRGRIVNKTRHRSVFEVCKLVAEVDASDDVGIVDCHGLFEFNFVVEEVSEAWFDAAIALLV